MRRLRRWGAVLAPLGVAAASLVAVGLMATVTGRPTLPAHVDVGTSVAPAVAPPVAHFTTLPTSAVTGAATTPASTQRSVATSPGAKAQRTTTVVNVEPRVRVEDENGRPIADNGTEPAKGRPDLERAGDK